MFDNNGKLNNHFLKWKNIKEYKNELFNYWCLSFFTVSTLKLSYD